MSNLIKLPTAKTYLYYQDKRVKPNINEVVNLIYDKIGSMTARQSKNLTKRLKIYDELIKLLPPGKQKLLRQYNNLYAIETNTILEAAARYMLTNEKDITEALVNY